ncbi:MAG TPA: branched-chain amino acid ABC transporter substrate-binding protein, partial [Armatimonadota bacterium]|nr:branched-chain amino acid ABC transporter substrate-binding protein [Armatimonadota bacterium]
MRRLLSSIIATLILISLGAAVHSATPKPIVIGCNLEMTGQVAAYGQAAWEGINIVSQIVKPEALGRPVEFSLLDNKSD